ncbi:MAG: HD domain-containing protein [Endomicrobium sp.]|nr:HD domain-containing protein [Endomicrobium sp.]
MNNIIEKINEISTTSSVYVIGGFVRDLLLGHIPRDIDLYVNDCTLEYSNEIARIFNSKLIILDEKNKKYRILIKNNAIKNIDVSILFGKTLFEDLSKRDFTINSVAFDLKNFNYYKKNLIFIDKSVLLDFKFKKLNTISSDSFKSDPLRILRGFRFISEIGFNFSNETIKQIKFNAKFINNVSSERIKNEFFRILSSKNATDMIYKMYNYGLLSKIFPEIDDMKKSPKKYYYHDGGLLQHSFETMESLENILNKLDKYFSKSSFYIKKHFCNNTSFSENVTRIGLLKFSAFFHDNAKPETVSFKNNSIHFFKHDEYGAKKIVNRMLDLKCSKNDIEYVSFLIKYHMYPSMLIKNNVTTKKSFLKLFKKSNDNIYDLFILSMSDWHSYKKIFAYKSESLKFQKKYISDIFEYYYEFKNMEKIVNIINGNILIEKFNLKQGPWIGYILNSVLQRQKSGEILNIVDALNFVSSKLLYVEKIYKNYCIYK